MEYSRGEDALHHQQSTVRCHRSAALGEHRIRLRVIPGDGLQPPTPVPPSRQEFGYYLGFEQHDRHTKDTSEGGAVRRCLAVFDFAYGPTEIRTRVSAVRGQRPWPLDDGALPLQQFRGRDSNPDSTVQSRMSCLLDDPGVIVVE